jgi:hypothetical protein
VRDEIAQHATGSVPGKPDFEEASTPMRTSPLNFLFDQLRSVRGICVSCWKWRNENAALLSLQMRKNG